MLIWVGLPGTHSKSIELGLLDFCCSVCALHFKANKEKTKLSAGGQIRGLAPTAMCCPECVARPGIVKRGVRASLRSPRDAWARPPAEAAGGEGSGGPT